MRLILLTCLFTLVGAASALSDEALRARSIDRSPVDVVLGKDEAWLATANQTSNSLSLVALPDGKVLDEVAVGGHPIAIIANRQRNRLFVSCRDTGEVEVFAIDSGNIERQEAIYVGFHPHGLALSPDEKLLYVALAAADQVAVIDLDKNEVTKRIATGRWPRYLALSRDGKRLAVGASGDRGVSVIDCERGELAFHETFAGLNIGHLALGDDGKVYFPWMVYRSNTITPGNIRLGWVLASRIGRLKLDEAARREAFSLDPQGKAIADVHGLALTSDNQRLVVSASGTHELLVYQLEGLPFKDYGGTDHIDPKLLADKDRFYRIPLGGRPMGLTIAADNRTVYVTNYLHNSVQVVDLAERKVAREIALGSAGEPSLARRGEAIFYDAGRSLDQWYSCHTCHYEGGISGERMDTLNDGTRNTMKTVLPLYHFSKTGPWTWHGWQKDARAAMRKSLTETMLGPPPDGEDIDALLAFLTELKPPPNPFRNRDGSLTAAAQRGERIFQSEKAGCANCHSGEYFTDGEVHDVGLGSPGDAYRGFNTPTLIGVYQKAKLLHDGRAKTLDEVLTGPHNPAKVTRQGELSDDERKDLIEYLKSL
jgi:YVTN family beta-propeller protein